ncbi:DUF6247 family protein [Streptomyces sp. cg28]|uniref:DUF6247 family protein n=1 Tax=Streptomyces sp. cg28 TaxID=3403457 RepID=UPI003B20FE72
MTQPQTLTDAELHARRAHPDYEYATTEGPRKQWDDIDVPPHDEEGEPEPGWERNTDAGRDGWERFDYTEESYWRRPRTTAGAATQATESVEDLATPKALRAALAAHTPQLLDGFDRHWRNDIADTYDLAPVPAFMARWTAAYRLARDPAAEAEVHRLENAAGQETDYGRAKAMIEEAGQIRRRTTLNNSPTSSDAVNNSGERP